MLRQYVLRMLRDPFADAVELELRADEAVAGSACDA
jgi:hypothetical protein